MKRVRSLVILAAALMLALGMGAIGVFAQDSYTPIPGDQTIPVKKTLDLNGAVYGPTHTVTFTVTEVGTVNTDPVQHAGGTMPSATVNFSGTDTEKTANLDFSTVTFPKPGLYKFTLTESDNHPSIVPTADSESSYDLYLLVDNVVTTTGQSTLVPASYKIVKGSGSSTPDTPTNKVDEALFENEYISYELDVDKQVTGNQGDKTKEFTVTVQFSGATGTAISDKYKVKWVAGTPKVNGETIVDGDPVDVAANSMVTLKLKDTDKVEFYGIPAGITYTVTETDANRYGYTTTYTGDTTFTFVDADKAVTVTNDKQGTLPTGIFINNWPYILAVLIALIAAAIFISRRRRVIEDEDL